LHGLKPLHIVFRTDHTIFGTTIYIDRTVCIEIGTITTVNIRKIKFINLTSFDNPCSTTGRNISYIGRIFRMFLIPSFFQFTFIFADKVLIKRKLAFNAITEILADIISPSEFQFNTPVRNFRNIRFRSSCISHYHIHIRSVQNSGSQLVINIYITIQFIIKETKIKTDISNGRLFPSKSGIGNRSDGDTTCQSLTGRIICCRIYRLPIIIADCIVAKFTPRSTKFQVGQPLYWFKPRLFIHTPAGRERRESSPAIIRRKPRRAIIAQVKLKQISALISIIRTPEHRAGSIFSPITSRRVRCCSGIKVIYSSICKSQLTHICLPVIIRFFLIANHSRHIVNAKRLVIIK